MASFIVIFIPFLHLNYALKNVCPKSENIAPLCICKDLGNGPMMLCSNVMSPEDLIPPIQETEKHNMFSLAIHDSSLLYFPKGLFKKTNYKKIRLAGTQLISLVEEDLAFEGLEDTLEEFRVMDAHYATQWSWSDLRDLNKLELIDVDYVSLGSISEPLPKLKSLRFFGVSRGDISFIVDDAFQELENIHLVALNRNEISELSRSMFPNPAAHLRILDLSENKLSSLPKDMFDNMPSLADVNLENNEFTTLTEAPFKEVFDRVLTLSVKGNDIRCDCRLRWMVEIRMPREFVGECSHPDNLKGWSLKYIAMKDLWC